MFVVLRRFAANRSQAGRFMDGHRASLEQGFADDVFLLAGALPPNLGGGVLARNISRAAPERRVSEYPLVVEQVVSAEIVEIAQSRAEGPFATLLG